MELSGTDFFAGYIDEVQSYIPQLNRGVGELQNSPNLGAGFEEFYRLVHIIKGASSMVGVQGLSKIAGYLESALDEIRDGRLEFSESVFAAIRQTIDSFDQYCHKLRNENSLDEEQLEQKIKDVFSGLSVSQIFFDSDIQNGMDELVPDDFLGILGEDSFSETADVPDTVSVSSKLDHSLDLLAGMILEKKILAKTAVEMIDKMHSLISTDYESTPQTTGNRSPLQLLRELSAWMLDSAELELFRLAQFLKNNGLLVNSGILPETSSKLSRVMDEMVIPEALTSAINPSVQPKQADYLFRSIDNVIESFAEFLARKVTLLDQVNKNVSLLADAASDVRLGFAEAMGQEVTSLLEPFQVMLSWMEESAEFELYRLMQIVSDPLCILHNSNRNQLAAHLETAFSGINQGVIVQNSGSEDCEFADNFQQFLVGLQGGPSGTDSPEVFDSLPGAASAAIGEEENGFFVDSDLVDDLLTDEESDKNADSSSLPEVDDELVAMFRGEAAEHLKEFDTSTQVLSKLVHGRSPIEGEIQKAIQKIRRSAHTIKGASAVIGMQNLSNLSGRIEDFVDWLHDTAQFVTIEIVNDLIKLLDLLQMKICTPEHFNELHAAELLESLQATIDSYPTGDDGQKLTSSALGGDGEIISTESKNVVGAPDSTTELTPPEVVYDPAPQALFSEEEQQLLVQGFKEEAEEHLLQLHASLQTLEHEITGTCQITADHREEVRKIRRAVHTIKGASAVIGLSEIASYGHGVEDFLDWLYERAAQISPTILQVLAESLDLLGMLVETPSAVSKARQDEMHQRLQKWPASEDAGLAEQQIDEVESLLELSQAPDPAAVTAGNQASTSLFSEEEQQLLFAGFLEEADEHLQQLHNSIQLLENEVQAQAPISEQYREEIRKIRRAVHTIKGASAVIGLGAIASYAHGVEDFLDFLYEKALYLEPAKVQVLAESLDALGMLVEEPSAVSKERQDELHRRLQQFAEDEASAQLLVSEEPEKEEPPVVQEQFAAAEMVEEEPAVVVDSQESSRTIRIKQQQFDMLLNLANELLVGVSGFDRNMNLFKNTIEELDLTVRRLKGIALELETKFEVKALDQLSQQFAHLDKSLGEMKNQESFAEFDALELDRYTQLNLIIRSLNESTIDVSAIHTNLGGIYSGISGDINRQYRVIRDIQIRMNKTRMSPLSVLGPRLSRTVREVAARLGKQVRFVIEGETVELDRIAWEKLADPFMHLIRNAIHHGLEDRDTRLLRQKTEIGTITLSGKREGNNIVLRFSDDGQGIDFAAIKEKAKSLGLLGNISEMSERQLTNIIFLPGFSTKTVSEISGRGVGMDVVRENIQELQGTVNVETKKGEGTTFVLRIPLTLGVVRALMFRIGSVTYSIALNDIKDIRRAESKDLFRNEGKYVDGSETLDFYSVHALLGQPEEQPEERPLILIMNASEGRSVALSIPQIIGQKEIVLKSVGSHLRAVPGIAGVAVMGDGSVVPVLNVPGLIEKAEQFSAMSEVVVKQQPKLPEALTVMIVDDSISIRRVMNRLVLSNGWVPVEAKDGLDALEILESGSVLPHCIVLDIEMPRMNGFELLAKLPNLAGVENIPVIMLTSRTSEKHYEKAIQLGAKGFLNKPCKDQDFVDTVLSLTGKISHQSLESVSEAMI